MGLFTFFQKNQQLKRAQRENWPDFLQEYLAVSAHLPSFSDNWQKVRFVVFDTETSGLNPRMDDILSIGAVCIEDESIQLGDSLDMVIQSPAAHLPEVIAVHGITPSEVAGGVEPLQAAEQFLGLLRDSIIVAHHAAFDMRMIERLVQKHTGHDFRLQNRFLDTAHLARRIEYPRRNPDMINPSQFSLDALCDRYDITRYDRHTSWGDALITTKLLLTLMRIRRAHNPPEVKYLFR